jgi:hypothetical protein
LIEVISETVENTNKQFSTSGERLKYTPSLLNIKTECLCTHKGSDASYKLKSSYANNPIYLFPHIIRSSQLELKYHFYKLWQLTLFYTCPSLSTCRSALLLSNVFPLSLSLIFKRVFELSLCVHSLLLLATPSVLLYFLRLVNS